MLIVELARPFTLIFPFVAAFAGLVVARSRADADTLLLGACAGAIFVVIHAGANAFNQYTDRDIDAANKPGRPIPSGRMSSRAVLAASLTMYAAGLAPALLIGKRFFVLAVLYAALTIIYSAPPRLKRFPWLSNLTIAVARGMLILMAGYAAARPLGAQIWALASVPGIYLLGAASTKDFSEVKGDSKFGIRTLPVVYGAEKTTKIIWPFFIFPFLLIPLYCRLNLLPAHMMLLTAFAAPGAATVVSMLRNPAEKAFTENSLSWALMYLTIIFFPITAMILELL